MSPQCGQNVLHVTCMRSRKSTSFYMYPEVEHIQLLDTCIEHSTGGSRIRLLRIVRILKHSRNFTNFKRRTNFIIHYHSGTNSCRLSAVKVGPYCPSSRELMQLGISQSQHSLVALLHQNNQSNGLLAPKMAKRIFTNFIFFIKFANFNDF